MVGGGFWVVLVRFCKYRGLGVPRKRNSDGFFFEGEKEGGKWFWLARQINEFLLYIRSMYIQEIKNYVSFLNLEKGIKTCRSRYDLPQTPTHRI